MPPKGEKTSIEKTMASLSPDLFDDEWARIEAAKLQREFAQLDQQERLKLDKQRRDDDRRRWWWSGAAGVMVFAIVCAVIVSLIFLWYRSDGRNDHKAVEKEKQRTLQVQACNDLAEPLERQFCIMTLNGTAPGNGSTNESR